MMKPIIFMFERVLSKIKPTKKDIEKVDGFLLELKEVAKIKSEKYGGVPMVCGSLGKGTWIREKYDVDLFIVFPKSLDRGDLEKIGLKVGKEIVDELGGSWTIKYAEHPYVRGVIDGFNIDIVPCYEMKFGDKIKSAVDRSPLHTAYVIEHLNDKQRDDVRLLKKLFKSLGVYGSDVKTEGISGYILELLVIKFKSFMGVMKFFSSANFGDVVDVENFWGGRIPRRIPRSALIVIDPVDKFRNASAALSAQNFYIIKTFARKFVKNPSESYFFFSWKPIKISALKSRGTKLIAIVAPRDDSVDDTLYPQMRKASSHISKKLRDFGVVRTFSWADDEKFAMIFELIHEKLPPLDIREGPFVYSKEHSRRFLEKHEGANIYIKGDRWYAETKREFRTPESVIRSLDKSALPKHVAKGLSRMKILSGEKFWKFIKETKELAKEMNKFYFSSSL